MNPENPLGATAAQSLVEELAAALAIYERAPGQTYVSEVTFQRLTLAALLELLQQKDAP